MYCKQSMLHAIWLTSKVDCVQGGLQEIWVERMVGCNQVSCNQENYKVVGYILLTISVQFKKNMV